jgi:hypothetical protein
MSITGGYHGFSHCPYIAPFYKDITWIDITRRKAAKKEDIIEKKICQAQKKVLYVKSFNIPARRAAF